MRIATTVLVMRIVTVLVMIIAVTSIVITFALIGAVVALLLQTDLIPVILIGALGGSYVGLAFLLNAGLNGKRGLQ